jgi:hypothetical protein
MARSGLQEVDERAQRGLYRRAASGHESEALSLGVLSALWTLPFVTLGIPYLSDRPAFITLVLASQCEKQRGNVHAENARQQYACGGFRSFAVPWNYWPMKGVRSNSADTRVHLFRDRHDR